MIDTPVPQLSASVQRSNIVRLTLAQALAGANSVVVYSTGAIIGNQLAPDKSLATLPISVFVVGMALCILPAGMLARRYGRRAAFLAGSASGILVGLLAAAAVVINSFWLFCLAMVFGGGYAAVVLSFRFAAADGVDADRRPRALSLVMGGGVAAGVLGPQLVTATLNVWPAHQFAATFIAQASAALLAGFILQGAQLPHLARANGAPGRSLRVIAKQPLFVTTVVCGAVTYMLMNFLMTAAPLAMQMCGHSQEDSNLGVQWHVIAMYAPSFFTGRLITRFGAIPVVATGLMLTALSGAVGLAGVDVGHFWLSLIVLGVGWNFGFVGSSALVLECHMPAESNRVQTLNDFLIFGTMSVGSFASGGLLSTYGWDTVLRVSFAPLAVAVIALLLSAAIKHSSHKIRNG